MNPGRLFFVLVLGGAMWTTGCDSEGDGQGGKQVVSGPDASNEDEDKADGGDNVPDGGTELAPCFCDREACCDDGVLEEGFECCWATSC